MIRTHLPSSLAALAALLLAPAAHAQWSGKAELGFLASTGNTESQAANARLDFKHEGAQWTNNLYFSALYAENGDFATAERYEARYQVDNRITAKFSWFFGLRGEQDRYSGFEYQATASTGAKFQFIDSPTTQLDVAVGAGLRRLSPQVLVKTEAGEVIARLPGESESDPVGTLASNYEHAFTESTKLTNTFLAEAGTDNTALQNDISLSVSMTKSFALAVGFGVRYNTDPPPLAEDTDTLTTINLVYNIP